VFSSYAMENDEVIMCHPSYPVLLFAMCYASHLTDS